MAQFKIVTDSCCDLSQQMIEELGIDVIPLSVVMGDDTYLNYPDWREVSPKDFYGALRNKQTASTSAINIETFVEAFEKHLENGYDVLYLAFSSALSGTYNASTLAAKELAEKYPDRKVICSDTLSASMGQGLLVYYVVNNCKDKSIEETYEYAESIKHSIVHWFTVDDLGFLHRGGRISSVTAVVGSLLSVKPILHVSEEGKLISVSKVRGRKSSIKQLCENVVNCAVDLKDQVVFISHGDCEEEALELSKLMKEKGVKDIIINYIGPVIGAHSGPGTLAIFCFAKDRDI